MVDEVEFDIMDDEELLGDGYEDTDEEDMERYFID